MTRSRVVTFNRRRRLTLVAAAGILTCVYHAPWIIRWRALQGVDMDQCFAWMVAAYRSVREFGQLPFWNPFAGGGMPSLYYADSFVGSPVFALGYVDPLTGIKVGGLVCYWAGLVGAYLLASHSFARVTERSLFATTYVLSGIHLTKALVGMVWAFSAMFIPLFLWGLIGTLGPRPRLRHAAGAAAATFLIVMGAGAYYVVYTALLGALIVLCNPRASARAALPLARLALWAIGLCSLKLVPSLAILAASRREVWPGGGIGLGTLAARLITPSAGVSPAIAGSPPTFWQGLTWGYDENSFYISALGGALACVGLFAAARRQRGCTWRGPVNKRTLAVVLVAGVWMSLGDAVGPDWSLLRLGHRLGLPGIGDMRVPQRAMILVIVALPYFSALGLAAISNRLSHSHRRRASIVVVLAQILLLVAYSWRNYGLVDMTPTERLRPWTSFDHSCEISVKEAAIRGRADCTLPDSYGLDRAAIPRELDDLGLYPGEHFFGDGSSRVSLRSWSPNRIVLDVVVDKTAPRALLHINQFYERSWRAQDQAGNALVTVRARAPRRASVAKRDGAIALVVDDHPYHLLSVRVPQPVSAVTLTYEPRGRWLGLSLFVLALLAMVAESRVRRPRL